MSWQIASVRLWNRIQTARRTAYVFAEYLAALRYTGLCAARCDSGNARHGILVDCDHGYRAQTHDCWGAQRRRPSANHRTSCCIFRRFRRSGDCRSIRRQHCLPGCLLCDRPGRSSQSSVCKSAGRRRNSCRLRGRRRCGHPLCKDGWRLGQPGKIIRSGPHNHRWTSPFIPMTDTIAISRECGDCGYRTALSESKRCPVCAGQLFATNLSNPSTNQAGQHTFSLSTLFLVITVICVGLGAIVTVPGIGVPFVVLAIPAFVRSVVARHRLEPKSRRWTLGERLVRFLGSIGLMLLIATAGVIAFQVACWTSCFGVAALGGRENAAFMTGLWVGGGAGVVAISWLLWRTWPKRER